MSTIEDSRHSALELEGVRGDTQSELKSRAVLRPAINSLLVINSLENLVDKDTDKALMLEALQNSMQEVKSGHLACLEAMLIGQATALQSLFSSLAMRASDQEKLPNYQAFMTLALKAQNQSRATISALGELKYPRQATFVKQANIAHGPQQVNNGEVSQATPGDFEQAHARAHEKKMKSRQNKLLEVNHGQPGKRLDARAAKTAERGNSAVETVAAVNRTKKLRR